MLRAAMRCALQSDRTDTEIARAYEVHPVTLQLEKEAEGQRRQGLRRR